MEVILLILSLLLGCSEGSKADVPFDVRADWSFYDPKFDNLGPPSSDMRWFAYSESEDDSPIAEHLQKHTNEWQQALACGTKITQVNKIEDSDVVFYCHEMSQKIRAREGNGVLKVMVDEDGRRSVLVHPDWCSGKSGEFYRYALGRGLGFDQQFHGKGGIMTGESVISSDQNLDRSISFQELDSFKIWSLRQGAPGCGGEDSKWSWETDPDRYRSHPSNDEIEQIISEK